jgi:aryl carrier-like protein
MRWCIKDGPAHFFLAKNKLIKYGLNSARAGKVNKTWPTSNTVMDFEMLHLLTIKASTICNKKERHIEN